MFFLFCCIFCPFPWKHNPYIFFHCQDFDMSFKLNQAKKDGVLIIGTQTFMSPEMLARIKAQGNSYAASFHKVPFDELKKLKFFGQGDDLWDGWAKVDMWGIGTVLFTMLFGYDPFYPMAASCCPQFKLLQEGDTQAFFARAKGLLADPFQDLRVGGSRLNFETRSLHTFSPPSEEAQSLLLRLLDPDCCSRATLQEVADHPWLQGPILDEVGCFLFYTPFLIY
jgi:serine/threonine protein kinase